MRRALAYVALPAEVTRSEVAHLERTNRLAWPALVTAVPLIATLAWRQHTGVLVATELTVALAAATFLAGRALSRPRIVSVVNGAAVMGLAALVVRFGPAPLAGELHGGFYVVLATLVVSCNPVVVLVAAAVAALLDATFLAAASAAASSDLGLRLAFLALETAACCVIARVFFDNLVGAEKTVRARTHELERKTRDLEVFLDIVDQGFVTLTRDGGIVASSAAFARTFDGDRTDTFFDRLERKDPSFADDSRLAWGQVEDDVLPVELALAQMPSRLLFADRVYRLSYRVADAAAGVGGTQFVAVVSDITSEIAREKAEREKREGALLLQRVVTDRQSVAGFVAEGRRVVELLQERADRSLLRRGVHTLKGNAAVLGASSIAEACHALETRFAERGDELSATDIGDVVERFRSLEALVAPLLAVEEYPRARREQDLDRLEALVLHGASRPALLDAIADLRLEPVQSQLVHLGDHARDLALRLGRAPLAVTIEAHDARMKVADSSGFWSAFVHLVHNAVDHGIETENERVAGGKARVAQIHLRAGREPGAVFVEIEDDGRGIDWERVEARARELGLPARTSQEEALFADGVSTAGEIDDLSGRGIGMGAIRAAVQELRGALTVDSRAGKGTRIRATLPALERHLT
jgi:two-component system chemotaxis sensor kinase CheA